MKVRSLIWGILFLVLVLPGMARGERSCKPLSLDMTDEEIECWNIWREEVGQQSETTIPDCPPPPPWTYCMDKEVKEWKQKYRKEHPFTRESIAKTLKEQADEQERERKAREKSDKSQH